MAHLVQDSFSDTPRTAVAFRDLNFDVTVPDSAAKQGRVPSMTAKPRIPRNTVSDTGMVSRRWTVQDNHKNEGDPPAAHGHVQARFRQTTLVTSAQQPQPRQLKS